MSDGSVNIKTREVAEIAGVDTSTVRRWAEDGGIPSVKTPGGHYRFDRADILARFAPNSQTPGASIPDPETQDTPTVAVPAPTLDIPRDGGGSSSSPAVEALPPMASSAGELSSSPENDLFPASGDAA